MATVAEILRSKIGSEVYRVAPTDSVLHALRMMADKEVGALMVLDGEKIAGIFTERDYARKVALEGRSSGDTPVSEIMTRAVRFVHPEQATEACMALMTEHRLRHLPVVDGGELVGLVSIGDLVNAQLEEQRFIISQMENYIVGNMGDSQL